MKMGVTIMLNAPSTGVVPGQKPGKIFVDGKGWVQAGDWKQYKIYDTEYLPTGTPIVNGNALTFFSNLNFQNGAPAGWTTARKSLLYTNMAQNNRLDKTWELVVYNVGVSIRPYTNADDTANAIRFGYFAFFTGNQRREMEGPVDMFPAPYGMTGSITMDGNLAPVQRSLVNNGIPSINAIGKNSVVIDIVDELTFSGALQFFNDAIAWTPTEDVFVRVTLSGYLYTPLM